jgi:hypothetical protein
MIKLFFVDCSDEMSSHKFVLSDIPNKGDTIVLSIGVFKVVNVIRIFFPNNDHVDDNFLIQQDVNVYVEKEE